MDRMFLAVAGGLGFLGVAAGAFGAHALKARLSADMLAIYQTGVLYHLIHAVALALVAVAAARAPSPTLNVAGYAFITGVTVFSGSLYILALSGNKILGAVTPLGGLCFLVGWAALVVAAIRS